MIKIEFKPPSDKKWEKWLKTCEIEQKTLNESYSCGKPKKVSTLYKKSREYFFDVNGPFHGKCAYCETFIIEGQPGDLDHYRPKNRITESSTEVKITDESGTTSSHPGYYWLAYNYRNLLPSCRDCNSPNTGNTADGSCVGKWNEFPVKEYRACKPGDEINEEPLLLNPTHDIDIENHLEVLKNGTLRFLSVEGETTCQILGLNTRVGLVMRRYQAYNEAYIGMLLTAIGKEEKHQKITIEEFKEGKKPFSAAGRAGIKAAKNFVKRNIADSD